MKISAYNIEKALLQFLLHMIGRLPLSVHHFNAKWIAFLIERVVKYRVALVDENLRHSFPEKSDAERLEIRHEFYKHFARIFTEAIWFGACTNPDRLKRAGIVTVKNPELLNECYDNAGSVMVMYTHQGNWELLGGIASYVPAGKETRASEKNFCVVYRKGKSRLGDEILRDVRFAPLEDSKGFRGYLESKEVVRYAFKNRGEKKIYNMNTDQHPYFAAPDFVKVVFMGRECDTMSASASLAKKFSMPVLYQRMVELEKGRYEIEYELICADPSEMSVEEIMVRYYQLLEDDIRRQPYNYLWTHNRWWRMNG